MGRTNLSTLILTVCLCNWLRIEGTKIPANPSFPSRLKQIRTITTCTSRHKSQQLVFLHLNSLEIRGGSDSQQDIANDDAATDEGISLSADLKLSTKFRLQGKECHDDGDFKTAGELFQQAADALENGPMDHIDEYATCRLHQALCHLKEERFDLCLEACTSILQDDRHKPSSDIPTASPVIRARAYHRRAKAKLALGDHSGALHDARSAAFLGDKRGVALYGRLMREPASPADTQPVNQESKQAHSPHHMTMFESLLTSGNQSPSSSLMSDFSPASLLMGNSKSITEALSSGKGGNLAQSVLKSLFQRLDDDNSHTTICNYLKKANKNQLHQLFALTGMSDVIQDSQIDRIVSICHSITPKAVKRTVKATKAAIYSVQLIRRILTVLKKYKTIIVALLILQWTKSALLRPIPIRKVKFTK